MADPEMDEDLFADLYDGEDQEPEAPIVRSEPQPAVKNEPSSEDAKQDLTIGASGGDDFNIKTDQDEDEKPFDPAAEDTSGMSGGDAYQGGGFGGFNNQGGFGGQSYADDHERQVRLKDDGKMFIGGLNWETTDQSLKDYFSQFGEVVECTVMRDGATGRSRGFGFLTFRDPKTVNTVMVKEHMLDGKLIDPKRAIPRDEQEKTAKIFVGGVSQEATETDFKEFFDQFGHVLDATLMMDKDTGRPRGFGFVTFDSEVAVDRTLEHPLAIHGKMIEVKRAQPRGNLREEEEGGGGRGGKFGRHGKGNQFGNSGDFGAQQNAMAQNGQNGGPNNMSPAMMAQYWQRMQQYFQMMQQQMASGMGGGMGGGMNPMAAMQNNPQMMQQMMARQGMNPQMMQQMAAMQGYPNGMQSPGSPMNGAAGGQRAGGFSAQEQLMFEQQKYERQSMARMSQGGQGNTWDGMYDDVPAPAGMQGGRGNFAGRGGRGGGRGSQQATPQPAAQAPANAPTGPKNAGKPGANYRGGGRGGHRGFHPYARGGG